MKKKILVFGAKGMLGQELVRAYEADERYMVVGWDTEDIDVTDFPEAERKIRGCVPECILNAVAYNAVDRCEEDDKEYQKAVVLNAEVPKFLAYLAEDIGATLVHYSTDYVFDGENEEGYIETAEPHPLSRYGLSKRQGEEGVMAIGGKYYLIRLTKLFGKPATSLVGKKSFFEKMLEVAAGKTEVTVVDDERSRFTYAPDLAQATKSLVEDGASYGIYHLTNEGAVTWCEAACELFRIAGIDVVVKPVNGDSFPRPAKRPRYSELLNTKRPLLRHYTVALKEFLREVQF